MTEDLGPTPGHEDGGDAFDRVSSLRRLLHDVVQRGGEQDVVTTFAEAVFAWDGVEASGYVHDVDGQWMLSVAAPGAKRGRDTVTPSPSAVFAVLAPLSADDAERFGFDPLRTMLAVDLQRATSDQWFLVFAEGFGSLNEPRVRLYVDLLRDALARASAIGEARTTWAVLQPLLGAGDVEAAATAALRALARALPALGAALVVTAPSGAIVLRAGDDEPQSSVRPFGRVSALASSARTPEGHAIDLAVRRTPGETFTRREQRMLDRTARLFATWFARALTQGHVAATERRAERRDFEQVLDHAAAQALGDGTDVSILVISAPDIANRSALLRAWVVELRGRLRGSDLAGALSDREVGVLLCGITAEKLDVVSARLCRHLKFGERGNPVGTIGSVSRAAGQPYNGSLVELARQQAARPSAADSGGRR